MNINLTWGVRDDMSKINQLIPKYRNYIENIKFGRNTSILQLNKWAIKEIGKGHKLINRCCPSCGTINNKAVLKTPVYNFVSCKKCGLVYANKILNEKDVESFYMDNKIYQLGWDRAYENLIKTRDKPANTSVVKTILEFRNGNVSCLDIGCSFGKLLYELKPHFKRVEGIELNKITCKRGEELFGIEIFNEQLEKLNFPYNSYDVIILNQVIEHLNELNSIFKEIYRILKPRGILYIGCPNMDSWSMKIFREKHIHTYTIVHINMFDRKSMEFFAKSHNFSVRMNRVSNELDISLIDLLYFLFNPQNFLHRFNYNPAITPISLAIQLFLVPPLQEANIIRKLGGGSYLEVILEK